MSAMNTTIIEMEADKKDDIKKDNARCYVGSSLYLPWDFFVFVF